MKRSKSPSYRMTKQSWDSSTFESLRYGGRWIQWRKGDLTVNCWVMFHVFLSSVDFFQNQHFQKILPGKLSEYQMVWIQIRTDILSKMIISRRLKSLQQVNWVSERVRPTNSYGHIEMGSQLRVWRSWGSNSGWLGTRQVIYPLH